MLCNSFIYLVILFLVPVAKSDINIDPDSCKSNKADLEKALNEVVDMSDLAYQRIQALLNGQLTGPSGIVTYNTFMTYFKSKNEDEIVASAKMLLGRSIPSKCFIAN
jgi:hypothetical protein